MDIRIVNPLDIPDWDDLILSFRDYSFFHTSLWARVLVDTYGYKPVYVTMHEGKDLSAVVPIMEVKSFLTGKRGVGLPFADHCEPLVKNNTNFNKIFEVLAEYGKKNNWTYIEFRSGPSWVPSFTSGTSSITGPASTGLKSFFPGEMNNGASKVPPLQEHDSPKVTYWGHLLGLLSDEKAVFDSFRSSTRRNIKKAVKAGVEVSFQSDSSSMETYFRLHALTRKRHGLPPQPFMFFWKILELVIARGNGLIALASWKGNVIAGAVFLFVGNRFVYKFGASDTKFQELRANNLVMSEAIQLACRKGFTTFDFGRTEPENEGLRQFKNGWGTKEIPLQYFRWGVTDNSWEIQSSNSSSKIFTRVFQKLPIPALKFIGRIMYEHMG